MILRSIFIDPEPLKESIITGSKKVAWWLLHAVRLQLFLTLVAWPILLCWGLPLSFLSPLGNILFAPFLFCFLILASLIFFAQLIGWAPPLLYMLLEMVTSLWLSCCEWSTPAVLLALPRSTWCCALVALVIACWIMYHPRWRQPIASTLLFSTLIVMVIIYGSWARTWCSPTSTLPYGKTSLHISYEQHKIILTDPGLRRCRKSCNNWISYNLLPLLSTHYGTLSIDEYRVNKLTPATYTLLTILCQKKLVRKIVVMQTYPKNMIKELQEIAAEYNVELSTQKE